VTSCFRTLSVGERFQETRIGVDGQDVPLRADRCGQQLGDAPGAGTDVGAAPSRGQAQLFREPERGVVVEPGQTAQPLAFGVPARIERVALLSGGE